MQKHLDNKYTRTTFDLVTFRINIKIALLKMSAAISQQQEASTWVLTS